MMFRKCIDCGLSRRSKPAKQVSMEVDDASTSSDDNEDFGFFRRPSNRPNVTTERFVLEIVGALGLSALANDVNSFCVVSKLGTDGKLTVLHRTKTIPNDTAPIWTLKTKSICFVELDKANPAERIRIELCRKVVGIPGINAKSVLGAVELTYSIFLTNGDSKRREYPVCPEKSPGVLLALRFRKASIQDWNLFQELQAGQQKCLMEEDGSAIDAESVNHSSLRFFQRPSVHHHHPQDHAGDVDFQHVSQKGILGNYTTVVENNTSHKAYRVWPFPDPDNIDETTFMTKAQIQRVAKEPSRMWVEAAAGAADNYGSIFLEVLGCDNLPNMDTELVNGLTDAFVACVYEDNFVRTAVVHDSLNPRWMPWSHRAFEFHIQHPSSLLILGVFDYDEGPLESHDPIGRVVIVPTLFEKDTMYTLKYPLYYNEEFRGTLTVRLRIHWHNPADASRAESFVRPPRFIINVRTVKAWKTLRYLTRGSIDMTDVTLDSVKLYATEVKEHWQRYCFFLDVVAHIVLWRGRLTVFGWSVWFPIHSMVFFLSLSMAVEYPAYLPSVLLYLIAYVLLCNNHALSHHPSPWSRVKSFGRVAFNHHFSSAGRVIIEPETGAEEAKLLSRLNEYRGRRVMIFLYQAIMSALKVYRVYSKNTPLDLSTEYKSGSIISKLCVNYLYYAHLFLRLLCKYCRIFRNFVNWRDGSTYKFTLDMLLVGTIWIFFPYKAFMIKMVLRGMVWMMVGPQNKLIDSTWILPYYRTREQLLADGIPETVEEMRDDILSRPSIFFPILGSKWVHEMGKSGRIVVEDNLKLQAAREARFGKYSESVPAVDSSRFASVPQSSSFAQPYVAPGQENLGEDDDEVYQDLSPEKKKWYKVPGQKLYGNILHQPSNIENAVPTDITL